MAHPRRLTVLQLVPDLESGGVERGTLEIAAALVERGHRSLVISGGGRMVEQLLQQGSEHITWPIGVKGPFTLRFVSRLRRLLITESIDILHARSRVPAWVGYLAWRRIRTKTRCRFVTTMHGLHSVSAYSAIMTRGERVIAVSQTMRDHILTEYPKTDPARIVLIHRGVDQAEFPHGWQPQPAWREALFQQYPILRGRPILTLPGRLTRLKGHHDFITVMSRLHEAGVDAAGLIVGGEDPRRTAYAREMRERVQQSHLDSIVFTGHRTDVRDILAVSDVVFSLSRQPESFGRTVLEALSLGRPVLGYDHGGVGEILRAIFPQGCVTLGDLDAMVQRTEECIKHPPRVEPVQQFTKQDMLDATLALYQELAAS